MASKIYTKTGDAGKTSLLGGTKVSKSHLRIEAYGTIDELNSFVGLLRDLSPLQETVSVLGEIQDRLFTIGSMLAMDPEKQVSMQLPGLKEHDVEFLEHEIDSMTSQLEPMKAFILPVGHQVISTAHVVRCVCRRAERLCVAMLENNMQVEPFVIKYLNRLSDYLFTLARYLARKLEVKEIAWNPRV